MAYLHCHNCTWSQDDFWTKNYNPLTQALSILKTWGKPRRIRMDQVWAREHKVTNPVHTWTILKLDICKIIRRVQGMKWCTEAAFRRTPKQNQRCPKCGSSKLDID